MMLKGKLISLETYTLEKCHEFYKSYIADSMLTDSDYIYDEFKVDKYYLTKISDERRCMFSIELDNKTIGEIQLKNIDTINKVGTLSIVLLSDCVKNRGYGTEAEKLIINYGFKCLGLKKILADTTKRNNRSKHV